MICAKKSDNLVINFRQSDDLKNSGDLRDWNWRHCDDSDNESDDSWPKWRPVSCQNVVSYDQVTTTRVVSYDHVTTTRVVSYDQLTTTGVVSYDLVTTLTDDSKLLSPSFHWLQEVDNWHRHRLPHPTHVRLRNKKVYIHCNSMLVMKMVWCCLVLVSN